MPESDPGVQLHVQPRAQPHVWAHVWAHVRALDIAVALSLLTRLPLRLAEGAYGRSAAAAWAWPLVGLVVAGLGALAALVALWLGLGMGLAALLALGVMVLVTGAMHEDGLADCADGFFGGQTRARRLEIMKDSRIGAYGVLALVLAMGLRWQALAGFAAPGPMVAALFCAAMVSRAAMAGVMHALPNARGSGLAQQTGRPPLIAALIAAALALLAGFALTGWDALTITALAIAASGAMAALARGRIGGQTGDVLGATQQVVEITVLLALIAAG